MYYCIAAGPCRQGAQGDSGQGGHNNKVSAVCIHHNELSVLFSYHNKVRPALLTASTAIQMS
jgi:hypothetical protein